MYYLTESMAFPLPLAPTLHNDGNYIISLNNLVRWLDEQAQELGVEVYPGFSASEVLYGAGGEVTGIATADMGINKDGSQKDTYTPGMELRGKQTLFAEGCRGSLSEQVMKNFELRKDCDPQTYGLGLKEIWEVPEEQCTPGLVQHTIGWPVKNNETWQGTFMYHEAPNRILIGMVVGLDYPNPTTSPYHEFQQFKHHPLIAKQLKDGTCLSYGARALNEGGFQAIPKLTFPGGALLGCSAGFLNVPKIKGSHSAMYSGMMAADAVIEHHLQEGEASELAGAELVAYTAKMEKSWVYEELKAVRNVHPSFKFAGQWGFMLYSGLDLFVLRGNAPWTFHNTKQDHEKTKPYDAAKHIEYPKPDGKLSFDILTNLSRSGTAHEDQPAHLRLKPDTEATQARSLSEFGGPEQHFCPAKVYEYIDDKLVINAQNCLHCKTCDIKTPGNYINWTVPEGGGGPNYAGM
jgi:electron-transferring-flavoprotein dehydrogenase